MQHNMLNYSLALECLHHHHQREDCFIGSKISKPTPEKLGDWLSSSSSRALDSSVILKWTQEGWVGATQHCAEVEMNIHRL
mmetsp:Transcript_132321/g.230132  ORF Transcript_132321/g.230132 Transcript_132321/m.230132 type:complete len:81 (-) Transcript_132321:734-976(-)